MTIPDYGTPERAQYETEERKRLELLHGTVYNTTEVQQKFNIEGFGAPLCFGTERETGRKVRLTFQHSPRFYWE